MEHWLHADNYYAFAIHMHTHIPFWQTFSISCSSLLSLCFIFNCVLYTLSSSRLPFVSVLLDGLGRWLNPSVWYVFRVFKSDAVWWLVLGHCFSCCCCGLCWAVCVCKCIACVCSFLYIYSTQKRDFVVCTCIKLMSICVRVNAFRSLFLSLDVAWGWCCGGVCVGVFVYVYFCEVFCLWPFLAKKQISSNLITCDWMLTMLDLRIDHHPMLHTTVAHTNFDLGSVSTPVSLALPVVSWLLIICCCCFRNPPKERKKYNRNFSKLDVWVSAKLF